MLEQDPTTGRSNMTDNFIADGAGTGGAVGAPLKLLLNAEKGPMHLFDSLLTAK